MIGPGGQARTETWLREIGKLGAFFRRDFLVAWSYRVGFVTSLVGLIGQAFMFSFVSRMVDPATLPQFGSKPTRYMEFVTVGIAVNALLNVGIGRMVSAMRGEQLMGTLESLLVTPTSTATLQLGLVLYNLIEVPIRMAVFVGISVALFDVDLQLGGLGPVAVVMVAFLPFVWGLGTMGAAAVLAFRQTAGFVGLGGSVLSVASGAFFPLGLFPGWLAEIVRYNPVAIALHAIRLALLGGAGWDQVLPQLMVLTPMSAVTLIGGLVTYHLAQQRERRTGTLGMY